ncbi:MAG: amidohydrolase family protein [Planctomycetota bacterium]|jgi:formimidoylglutamate deiminase
MTIIQADLTWTGRRFERGVQIHVEDGSIVKVGQTDLPPDQRLHDRALLPGFVNAHSHAFQRGLRGRAETFREGPGGYRTWRDAMYDLAVNLDADQFRAVTAQAFREMRAAGITCVGEFHYFHHATDDPDYALDGIVLEAAQEAGLRIVLLNAYYNTGGINRPLKGAQQRFRSTSPDAYWQHMDRLVPFCEGPRRTLGAAVHSLRAASREDFRSIYTEARRRGIAFHMHLEAQRGEIEECRAAYDLRPMELVLESVEIGESCTCVDCTHTDPRLMERYRAAGGNVCVCPLTEANRGDGLADVAGIGTLSLGTDSNARISMLEEMRWLEYGQRLAQERRGILRDEAGAVGPALLHAATETGARALGVPAGRIAPRCWADFVAIDLGAPTLAGWTVETLPASLVGGAGEEAIAATCVGGHWHEERA